ncbi:unnamed protein product, partial [Amoebophrya sp. A25]
DEHILDFAHKGLRTLLLGYRWLSESEFRVWQTKYRNARGSVDGPGEGSTLPAEKEGGQGDG